MSENLKRPSINPSEFDGGGTDDEVGVDSMRSMLHGGVQAGPVQANPPPPMVLMGNVPPQVAAAASQPQFTNHPLQPQFQQQSQQMQREDDFQMPQAMNDAQSMYQNARKLMKQQQQGGQQAPSQQFQQTQPQFNADFNPAQMVQKNKYGEFKDPKYEETIKKLTGIQYEEIELPSMGKFYLRGEGPSNGKLHIRPMTGNEQQILTTPRYVKKNQALNMIFKECIGEQINPDLLLSEDRTFLLIYLRGISYSPMYDVEVKCPDCTKTFQNQIHLNSLDVNYCPSDFGYDDLEDTLPTSGLPFRYRLSSGRDESAVQEHRDQLISKWGSEVADDTTLFRCSMLLEHINGVNNKMMIQQIVSLLPVGDMAYLNELINEPPFGVDTKVGIICPHCSHEFKVDMPMEISFFFPKPNLQKKKKKQA